LGRKLTQVSFQFPVALHVPGEAASARVPFLFAAYFHGQSDAGEVLIDNRALSFCAV
jgi:hypothetical protein